MAYHGTAERQYQGDRMSYADSAARRAARAADEQAAQAAEERRVYRERAARMRELEDRIGRSPGGDRFLARIHRIPDLLAAA
jgi:hypothetical protein